MRDGTNIANGFFKHAMRRRIGDHRGRKCIACRNRFGAEIFDIHIAVWCGFDHHNLHSRHLR